MDCTSVTARQSTFHSNATKPSLHPLQNVLQYTCMHIEFHQYNVQMLDLLSFNIKSILCWNPADCSVLVGWSTWVGWVTRADGSTRIGRSTRAGGSTRACGSSMAGGSTLQDTAGSSGRGPQGPPQLPWKSGSSMSVSILFVDVDAFYDEEEKQFTFPCEWYFRSGTQLVLYGQWGHWNLILLLLTKIRLFSTFVVSLLVL